MLRRDGHHGLAARISVDQTHRLDGGAVFDRDTQIGMRIADIRKHISHVVPLPHRGFKRRAILHGVHFAVHLVDDVVVDGSAQHVVRRLLERDALTAASGHARLGGVALDGDDPLGRSHLLDHLRRDAVVIVERAEHIGSESEPVPDALDLSEVGE